MKIALIGYGKMGKEIETIAIQRGHQVILKINRDVASIITDKELLEADVAIEFSKPNVAVDNMKRCFNIGLPIVVGTTGWYEEFEPIKKLCFEKNATLFHATNFSLGVNLFFKVNTYLAELMNNYTDYDVSIEEIHHIHKLDKPSGTAITLANQILQNIERKKNWSISSKEKETLFIQDIREGERPGTHIIKYQSAIDDIEIMHKAHNRKGFALGAVIAAEFLPGKKGIYSMTDII